MLQRFDAFWFAKAKAERLALFRVALGAFAFVYCLSTSVAFCSVSALGKGAFSPVGPVILLDSPLPAWLTVALVVLSVTTSALVTVGYRVVLTGPALALLFLWTSSYRSSFGMVFHTDNLLCLHLLLLAAAPSADVLSLDALSGRTTAQEASGRYGWALRAVGVATVVGYFLAGVAKLKLGGLDWAGGDALRAQVAYDNLRKIELGSLHSPLGAWAVSLPWLFPPLALATLVFELGGAFAFFGRRAALVWSAGIWAFHFGVLCTMAIAFPYPLAVVPFLGFFALEDTRPGRALVAWNDRYAHAWLKRHRRA